MNREHASKILGCYGRPRFKVPNGTTISFARQHITDIEEIEKATTEHIIKEWKALTYMNYIASHISLNEMQRISLLELEMAERNIETKPLKEWYEREDKKEKERIQKEIEEYNKENKDE